MTQAQPPATPAPPAQDLGSASTAAQERLAAAFPEPNQPGMPAPDPAAPPADAPFDIFADGAVEGLNLDGLQYRDGAKLAKEIANARDRFKPFNDAFGSLSDERRAQLLAAAPELGDDLAVLSTVSSQLHPDDRAYFVQAMELMATDPVRAAEMLSAGADALRGTSPAASAAAPAPPAPPAAPDLSDPAAWGDPALLGEPQDSQQAPVTRADLEAWSQQRDAEAAVKREEDLILGWAREHGYAPESQDPFDRDRFQSLLAFAGQQDVGGDMDRAHKLVEQRDQAIIDRFVEGKTADASRPAAPADAGAAPADVRVLSTTEDALQAMKNRMDATLGPDPRARGSED